MRPAVVAYRLLQLNQLRCASKLTSFDPRCATKAATLFAFVPVVTRLAFLGADEADGPRATCSGEPTSKSLSPREGLGDLAMNPSVHLDDVLRRRLPVALATWAERPSEGHALLGMLRGFPSSASPVHPFVTDAPSTRFGVSSRPGHHRSRPSKQNPPAKRSPVSRIRVLFTANSSHGWVQIALRFRVESVSPHAAPAEGALRSAPPPFPVEDTSLGF